MRQIVATFVATAFLIGLSGCDSGGADVGMPAEVLPPKPADMTTKFDKMKEMAKGKSGQGAGLKKPG